MFPGQVLPCIFNRNVGDSVTKKKKKVTEMTRTERITYWKDKYRDTPNGYWVAMIIGSEYINDMASMSKAQRKSYKKRKKRLASCCED